MACLVVERAMLDLTGKVAVVTGSSRGIGRAIAILLAGQGAKVIVNSAHSAEAADAVAQEIRTAGGEAISVTADVSVAADAERLIKAAVDSYGRLDILVNNAGTTRDTLLMRMSEADWDTVIDLNLKGAFNCTKAAARPLLRTRGGRIINVTSVSGLAGNAGQANYAASKAGLVGFTKSVAREFASRAITCNAVAPGFVPTALTNVLTDDLKAKAIEAIPLGRTGSPEEIAAAVVFLASDEAAYITGHVLTVDGGMTMM
jgi:3-oxoacyl-[acyl-carrier protein] reductase